MNIKKEKDQYTVESSSGKGAFYKVDPKKPWCDCPGFRFREMKRKGVCKHIKAVREYIEKKDQKTLKESQERSKEVLSYIEAEGGQADVIELIDKFGEDLVDQLISQGELIEKKGKITMLK